MTFRLFENARNTSKIASAEKNARVKKKEMRKLDYLRAGNILKKISSSRDSRKSRIFYATRGREWATRAFLRCILLHNTAPIQPRGISTRRSSLARHPNRGISRCNGRKLSIGLKGVFLFFSYPLVTSPLLARLETDCGSIIIFFLIHT